MAEADKQTIPPVVRFSGSQTIANAEDVLKQLAMSISEPGDTVIDCGGLTDVDLSFVQLLLSARRSARGRAKVLRLSAPVTGPLLDALRRGGFVHPAKDSPPLADESFWLGTAP